MNATNGNVQKRRAILQHALNDVGYADSCIQFDWPVSNPEELCQYGQDQDPYNLPGGKPWRLDVVAFCDERERNWATTAFAAELNRLDLVRDREAGGAKGKATLRYDRSAQCTVCRERQRGPLARLLAATAGRARHPLHP